MASGKGDEFYGKVENFVRLNGLSRRVSRLATHVEIKVAVAMREQTCATKPWVLDVAIRDGWGYLQYADDATFVVTDGDPASPAAPGDADFSAGTGLPIAQVVAAVQQFVRTGKLPETVPWREV